MSNTKKYSTTKGEYNGKPTISLHIDKEDGSKVFVMSFGTAKAKAILAAIEDIKKFVEGDKSEEG